MAITITGRYTQTGKSTVLPTPAAPGGNIGVFAGGEGSVSSYVDTVDYITITSEGNAIPFGTLPSARRACMSTSNSANDKGIIAGGRVSVPTAITDIDYFTISTPGSSTPFGDLSVGRYYGASSSNGTNDRAVTALGATIGSRSNVLDWVTISSSGTAVSFAEQSDSAQYISATSNATNDRGIFTVGFTGTLWLEQIWWINISSASSATLYGDLSGDERQLLNCATSNGTNDRAVFGGGFHGVNNVIDYIEITAGGTATDFGDLSTNRFGVGAVSNGVGEIAVFGGGTSPITDTMEYINIGTGTGDAQVFGVLTIARRDVTGMSNA